MRSMCHYGLLCCVLSLALVLPRAASAQTSGSPGADLQALHGRLDQLSNASTRAGQARVSDSVLASIRHLLDVAERIRGKFPSQALEWQERAKRHLEAAERGEDL